MLNNRDYGLLLEIKKCASRIQTKMHDVNFDAFAVDYDLREIICFNLLQIGELAKNLSDEFVDKFCDVPWKLIKGMRDKVVHSYGSLDLQLIFNTAIKDIDALLNYCKAILSVEQKSQNLN